MNKALKIRFASVVLLGLVTLLGGCEIPGVFLHLVTGDPPIHAQYEPPKDSPILVLVENYRSPDDMRLDSDQIAHQVGEEMKKEGKLDAASTEKIEELREEDADKYRAMNIAAVGKATDAKVVVYVDLIESEVSKDASAGSVHALATARVKVVDVKTGNTLWPSDSTHGREVSQTMEYDQTDGQRAVAMHTEMLTRLSSKIAKLFYTWKAEDQDQENAGG